MSSLIAVLLAAGASQPAPVRRVAILVGANQPPPGRAPLRFSYKDATAMADVLHDAGQFAAADIHLLDDPEPAAVLAALDAQLASLAGSESLLVFYYSGHADDQALYPHGQALSLDALKARLESPQATVRIGILDSCSGGAWTQAKGLTPNEPFEVHVPLSLTSEGSALIASSSGVESAHESESLQGSFFTHHFVAGLRGAADRTGAGEVTLGEAFAYAQERTIRDSAEQANAPQHPSFDIHLHGRQDLALTRQDASPSLVVLDEYQGPLQIIQLQTGLVVLEVPRGERTLKLALPPGHYLIQRHTGKKTYAQEIEVASGATTELDEEGLTLVASPQVNHKGGALPDAIAAGGGIPAGDVDLHVIFGVSHTEAGPGVGISGNSSDFVWGISAVLGITDRLEWPIGLPALAYRFGNRGGIEWIPWGGVIGWGPEFTANGFALDYRLGAGVDGVFWLGNNRSLDVGVATFSNTAVAPIGGSKQRISPDTWAGVASVGLSQRIKGVVTLNLGLSWTSNYVYEGKLPGPGQDQSLIGIGSDLTRGGVGLPLVSVHVMRNFNLDGYASVLFDLHGNVQDSYEVGVSCRF